VLGHIISKPVGENLNNLEKLREEANAQRRKEELETLQETVSRNLMKAIDELKVHHSTELAVLKARHETEVEELRAKSQTYQTELAGVRKEVEKIGESASTNCTAAEAKAMAISKHLKQMELRQQTWNNQTETTVKNSKHDAEKRFMELSDRIKEMQTDLSKTFLNKIIKETSELRAGLSTAETKLLDLSKRLKYREHKETGTSANLRSIKKALGDQSEDYLTLKAQMEQLTTTLSGVETEVKNVAPDVGKLEMVKKQLRASSEKLDQLEQTIEVVEKKYEESEGRYSELFDGITKLFEAMDQDTD
jgi:DNA repair exonuclease SbcCD ATPase subunit